MTYDLCSQVSLAQPDGPRSRPLLASFGVDRDDPDAPRAVDRARRLLGGGEFVSANRRGRGDVQCAYDVLTQGINR